MLTRSSLVAGSFVTEKTKSLKFIQLILLTKRQQFF